MKNLLNETKNEIRDEISNRDHMAILLNIEHIQFVKVTVKPRCSGNSIRINKAVQRE